MFGRSLFFFFLQILYVCAVYSSWCCQYVTGKCVEVRVWTPFSHGYRNNINKCWLLLSSMQEEWEGETEKRWCRYRLLFDDLYGWYNFNTHIHIHGSRDRKSGMYSLKNKLNHLNGKRKFGYTIYPFISSTYSFH